MVEPKSQNISQNDNINNWVTSVSLRAACACTELHVRHSWSRSAWDMESGLAQANREISTKERAWRARKTTDPAQTRITQETDRVIH